VPCRYINGTPLPPRARLSLQPLISIVCRTNSMVQPQSLCSRKGRGGRQPAQTFSKCRAVASHGRAELRGSDEQAPAFTSVADCARIRMTGAILATGTRLKDKYTHPWRHAAYAPKVRIDLADLRFPY